MISKEEYNELKKIEDIIWDILYAHNTEYNNSNLYESWVYLFDFLVGNKPKESEE